jgi:hypothetical protein
VRRDVRGEDTGKLVRRIEREIGEINPGALIREVAEDREARDRGSEHEYGQHDDQHEPRDDPQQTALQEAPRVRIAQPALRHQIAAHDEEDLDP